MQKHEWKLIGWQDEGMEPCAHEWECIHCGITLNDGECADFAYCHTGDE